MSNFALLYGSEMMLKTYTPTYEFTFKWTVEKFSKLPEIWIKKSPEFSIEPQSNWHVEFQKGQDFCLYICRKQDTNFNMSYDLTIGDCNHKILYSCTGNASGTIREDANRTVGQYMTVLNSAPNDLLLITITIKVEKNSPTTIKLSKELKNILDPTLKTDLTLVVREESIACHKAILAEKSPVFAKMFLEGTTDEKSSTKHIDDISLSAVKILLSFIYSVEMFDFDTALEVYAAADKYEVLDLKNICGLVLASKVTIETAPKVLYLADVHKDSVLKDKIMQFITLHYKPNERELTLKS